MGDEAVGFGGDVGPGLVQDEPSRRGEGVEIAVISVPGGVALEAGDGMTLVTEGVDEAAPERGVPVTPGGGYGLLGG